MYRVRKVLVSSMRKMDRLSIDTLLGIKVMASSVKGAGMSRWMKESLIRSSPSAVEQEY